MIKLILVALILLAFSFDAAFGEEAAPDAGPVPTAPTTPLSPPSDQQVAPAPEHAPAAKPKRTIAKKRGKKKNHRRNRRRHH